MVLKMLARYIVSVLGERLTSAWRQVCVPQPWAFTAGETELTWTVLTSENIAVEQAGSQVVTVMDWGVQEFVLKSLRFRSWNTELAKGQYLVSGYTWVV